MDRPPRAHPDAAAQQLNQRIGALETRVSELQEDIQGLSELLQSFIEELRGSLEVVDFDTEDAEGEELAN